MHSIQSDHYALRFVAVLCGLSLVAAGTFWELARALRLPGAGAVVGAPSPHAGGSDRMPVRTLMADTLSPHPREVVRGLRHAPASMDITEERMFAPHARATSSTPDPAAPAQHAREVHHAAPEVLTEAQYDTLLRREPTAALFLSRARLRAARNDLRGAMADAVHAERLEPSVDAMLMQGDIARWLDVRDAARAAYARASDVDPNDPRVHESQRLLAVQRRAALRYEPNYGTVVHSSALGDSEGFASYVVRAQSGIAPFVDESVVSIGGEVRHITGSHGHPLSGVGGDIGVARIVRGFHVTTRAGAVSFGGGPAWTGLLEVARRAETISLRMALTRSLAYDRLRSGSVVAPDSAMSATALLGSLSAQLAPRVDLYLYADHARLSDGNAVNSVVGTARVGWHEAMAVLLTASRASFSAGTARYFSPERFVMHGIGLEARRHRREGLSLNARVMPMSVWVREHPQGRSAESQRVWQATLSAEATWRRPGWEVSVHGGYGQDRAGNYSAGFGGLRARVIR